MAGDVTLRRPTIFSSTRNREDAYILKYYRGKYKNVTKLLIK